ncbi:MAG: hypothetical protein AAFO07_24125, partial [Bacteroidota bacterium]
MSATSLILILLSSIGFLISGLFSAYLLLIKNNKSTIHMLLGGLLLVLSIRVGKSVFYNFTELHIIIKNIGLAANLAIGPFLLLYGKVLIHAYALKRKDFWHFLPAAIYVVFSGLIPNQAGNDLWFASYSLVMFQQFCYLILSARLIKNWKLAWHHTLQKGFVILWSAIGLIWLTYLLIFLQILPTYIFGALAYSILVVVLAYFVSKEGSSLLQKEKYGPNRLSAKQSQAVTV